MQSKTVFAVLAVLVIIACIFGGKRGFVEGFSYRTCRQKGYGPNFCVSTPIAGSSSGTCTCADGSHGVTMKGTGARCMCGNMLTDSWLQPTYPLIYDGTSLRYKGTRDDTYGQDSAGEDGVGDEEDDSSKKKGWWYKTEWI